MHRVPRERPQTIRDASVVLAMLGSYWLTIFPRARRELRGWARRAERIPDPVLRRHARATLRDESGLAEGAAIFATLVTPCERGRLVRLLVAFQVMYDYLDTLTEQPVAEPLPNGRRLYRALTSALGDPPPPGGYYAHHPQRNDGGYLEALVRTCRGALADLPASAVVAAAAARAARRSAEGQSLNHAGMLEPTIVRLFERWSNAQVSSSLALEWWEIAAGASSSLALHALLAAAADRATTAADAARIDAAYFPWVNMLSTLLDGLVDSGDDDVTGNHSYVGHYPTATIAAQRIGTIAARAAVETRALPRGRRHAVVLAAMIAYYLSAPQAGADLGRAVARDVLPRLDVSTTTLTAVLRLRRRFG